MLYIETPGKVTETTIKLKFRVGGELSSVLTFFAILSCEFYGVFVLADTGP